MLRKKHPSKSGSSRMPTVLIGIMRGAAPIIDILSRIFKLPTAYIVIQSYSGKGLEDKQGDLIFARDIIFYQWT